MFFEVLMCFPISIKSVPSFLLSAKNFWFHEIFYCTTSLLAPLASEDYKKNLIFLEPQYLFR